MTEPTMTHDHPDGDDAPSRYIDSSGRTIYRASSLGRCERALVAAARGETAQPWPEWFLEVLNEGKRLEGAIIESWEATHPESVVESRQSRVELEVMDDVLIVGHIDGMTYAGEVIGEAGVNNCLVEVKKIRKSGWQDFITKGVEVHDTYPWQVAFDMHALGVQDCAFIGGLVENGVIVDTFTHWLTAPPLPLKAIVKRIRSIERMIGAGFGAMEIKCRADFPCPYYLLHDEKVDPETGEPVVDDAFVVPKNHMGAWQVMTAEFGVIDQELKSLKTKVEIHESSKAKLSDRMREFLVQVGGDKAKEIHGRGGSQVVMKRMRYSRKAYEVKAAEIDYWKIEDKSKTKESKETK